MKKLFLLTLTAAISASGFAQTVNVAKKSFKSTPENTATFNKNLATVNKTTGVGDTLVKTNVLSTDTLVAYGAGVDSGYIAGTNYAGDKGFAERFAISGADSSVQVIGAIGYYHGRAASASTKTINVKVWNEGTRQALTGANNVYYSGFPNTTLASAPVQLSSLRKSTGVVDTFVTTIFSAPTTAIGGNFFVGYDINYTWSAMGGDTVGLVTTKYGNRHTAAAYLSGTDTMLNVQNATQYSDGSWHDNYWDNYQIPNHYVVYAIFVVRAPLGVTNVTKGNLSFFGNYPNPAVNNTNIKFALKNSADVNVQIMDMNGRVLNTINQSKLGAGEHIIAVETSALAAGNYIYVIRTSEGDGMASQLTIVK